MPALSTITSSHARRARLGTSRPPQRSPRGAGLPVAARARFAAPEREDRAAPPEHRRFTRLIDAKAASELLGVPHTWLLAQARERRIPHHRLGHYVRFDPEDLREWLNETRLLPNDRRSQAPRTRA